MFSSLKKNHFFTLSIFFLLGSFFIIFPFLKTPIWFDESWRVMKLINRNYSLYVKSEFGPTPLIFDLLSTLGIKILKDIEIGFRIFSPIFGLFALVVYGFLLNKITKNLFIVIIFFYFNIFKSLVLFLSIRR